MSFKNLTIITVLILFTNTTLFSQEIVVSEGATKINNVEKNGKWGKNPQINIELRRSIVDNIRIFGESLFIIDSLRGMQIFEYKIKG